MTTNQLSIFDMPLQPYRKLSEKKSIVSEPKVEDIRSAKQRNNRVSYDVGEKIGGARKDIAQQKREFLDNPSLKLLGELEDKDVSVAAELIIRETFFTWFSFEDCQQREVDPIVAKMIQLFINRIPKAAKDTPVDRRKYVTLVTYISDLLRTVKTEKEFYMFEKRMLEVFSLYGTPERLESRYAERLEQIKTVVSIRAKATLIKEAEEMRAKLHMFDLAKTMAFREYPGPFVNYFTKHSSRIGTLRKAYEVESYDELIPNKDKNTTKTRTKRKPAWERVLPEHPLRSGGKSIAINSPEAFVEHFGFRASEFGNYVDDSTGAAHLLRSAEAYTDLANILEIPTEAVSLRKELAMAFGARGRGSALGHYEPARKVINLTKEKGSLGILAHEWFHALDHYLFNASHSFKNGKLGYLTQNEGGELPIHVQETLDQLLNVLTKGDSVAYIDVSDCNRKYQVGAQFQHVYLQADGDLQNFMDLIMKSYDHRTEVMLEGIVSESHLEKQKAKYARKRVQEQRKMAEALAEYHKDYTGEDVKLIPYTTDRSNYYQSAINLDKGSVGKYWSSNVELAARAFESYINDKLKERGWTSDYLVCGVRDSVFPQGVEKELVYLAMDRFMDAIRPLLIESIEDNNVDFSFLNS